MMMTRLGEQKVFGGRHSSWPTFFGSGSWANCAMAGYRCSRSANSTAGVVRTAFFSAMDDGSCIGPERPKKHLAGGPARKKKEPPRKKETAQLDETTLKNILDEVAEFFRRFGGSHKAEVSLSEVITQSQAPYASSSLLPDFRP